MSPTSKGDLRGATPAAQRAGAAQTAVTYAAQTISDPPTQVQVQAINGDLVATVTLLTGERMIYDLLGGEFQECPQKTI